MNDRFKFRAFITCHICIGVEEEKEISFYIYDVAVYSNGDIGFSRDALLDALSKLDLTENQKDEIEEEISENSYCDDYEWYSIEFGKTEQCTSIKDKNGKLIYENDLIDFYGKTYQIVWDNDFACFSIKNNNSMHPISDITQSIVIGNIH